MKGFKNRVVVKLDEKLVWEDKTYHEVELDFAKVTGQTIIRAEQATASMSVAMKPVSAQYCTHLASAISGVRYEALNQLHAGDFDKVWQTVGAFVGGSNPQEFYDQFVQDEGDEVDFTSQTSIELEN